MHSKNLPIRTEARTSVPIRAEARLTDHFTLAELTASQEATRAGLSNEPTAAAWNNLLRLANFLEQVRTLLGNTPILISSGYRSPAVNSLVRGARNSAHVHGLAADFIAPYFASPKAICQAIQRSGLAFDQLINEGTWVHIGLAQVGKEPRREVLTAHFDGGTVRYSKGLK